MYGYSHITFIEFIIYTSFCLLTCWLILFLGLSRILGLCILLFLSFDAKQAWIFFSVRVLAQIVLRNSRTLKKLIFNNLGTSSVSEEGGEDDDEEFDWEIEQFPYEEVSESALKLQCHYGFGDLRSGVFQRLQVYCLPKRPGHCRILPRGYFHFSSAHIGSFFVHCVEMTQSTKNSSLYAPIAWVFATINGIGCSVQCSCAY